MPRRLLGTSLLITAFVLVLAVDVHAQKKKDADKKDTPVIDSGKFAGGEFLGTLRSVPGTDRMFLLETESQQLVPSGGGGRGNGSVTRILQLQMQIQQAQAQAAAARSPQQRMQAMSRLQNLVLSLARSTSGMSGKGGMPAGYKMNVVKREIEFQASEAVKVRTLAVAEQFDEKGNPKKFTAKELAEMKGKDKGLPGFQSGLDKLEVGQKIRVVLGHAPAKADADKDKEKKPKDDDDKADKRMQVKMIVVLTEATGGDGKEKRKKK